MTEAMEWFNQNILPLPLWGVVLMLVGSIIASIFFVAWAFFTEKPWKRTLFIVPAGLFSISALIALIVWLVTASQGKEIDYTEDCEVKLVTTPDGRSMQMFYAANENHNANEMFAGIVTDDCVVRHYVYKRTYCGIYYTAHRAWLDDTYRIVKRGSEEPRSDLQRKIRKKQ